MLGCCFSSSLWGSFFHRLVASKYKPTCSIVQRGSTGSSSSMLNMVLLSTHLNSVWQWAPRTVLNNIVIFIIWRWNICLNLNQEPWDSIEYQYASILAMPHAGIDVPFERPIRIAPFPCVHLWISTGQASKHKKTRWPLKYDAIYRSISEDALRVIWDILLELIRLFINFSVPREHATQQDQARFQGVKGGLTRAWRPWVTISSACIKISACVANIRCLRATICVLIIDQCLKS